MTQSARHQHRSPQHLTTSRGAALYIGALLGPGLLLLPGLAAAEAGPASILAWLALLALSGLFAAVFSALGRNFPSAGGVMGYVAAGLGERIGLVAAWSFLAAVVGGAPIVCLIGASYVTRFAGGGQLARAAVAAVLLLIVLALAAVGLRASAGAQLILVSLLISVVAVAIAGSGASSRAANWSPFAPHGWPSVGHAAATLMLSFVGWEAVAPLTPRFADPARQLPRVVGIALAVTTALYLGLAIATTSVLGPAAATTVPLADLLRHAIGPAGPAAAAAAAVVLTLGTTNAYVNGAATMARQLTRSPAAPPRGQRPAPRGHGPAPAGHGPALAGHGPAPRGHGPALAGHGPAPRGHGPALASHGPAPRFLAAIAVAGLLLLTLYGLRLVSTASLVAVPTPGCCAARPARQPCPRHWRSSSCWPTAAGRS